MKMTEKMEMENQKVKTPRGTFNVKFKTIEEAKDKGFTAWFAHDGYLIVGNGTQAVAVAK